MALFFLLTKLRILTYGSSNGSCKVNMNKVYAKFLKTGDIYEILSLNYEMKDPITREWLRAVSYKKYRVLENGELKDPGPNFEGRVFVREYQDFKEKFELCLGI